jgi:hypothetical protein
MSLDKLRLEQLRITYKEYYKNYSILLTLGVICLVSAYTAILDIQMSILIFLIGTGFIKPLLYLVSKTLGNNKIHKEESLKLHTKSISIGILLGIIVGFFPFVKNINLFFPTFTILFGIIFGAIGISTSLRMYILISLILISGGIYIGHNYPDDFSRAGYFSAQVMIGFAILNVIFGKRARILFRILRRKIKSEISPNEPEKVKLH